SGWSNSLGNGNISLTVTGGTPPGASSTASGSGVASAAIPAAAGYAHGAALPAGANAGSFAKVKGGLNFNPASPFWSTTAAMNNGDTGDNFALLPFVTPTSTHCTATLDLTGTMLNSTMASIHDAYSLSDEGAAQRITYYAYMGTVPLGYDGPLTGLPGWNSQAILLRQDVRVGPNSGSQDYTINMADSGMPSANLTHLYVQVEEVLTSVPTPGAVTLSGLAGLVALRRRRN
ncbi:MAG TPA: hypothetical protein VG797_01490, partial [Phycisphaerales bacterium]|nr:hypothetical protein [Phycisphaerales bacterium]